MKANDIHSLGDVQAPADLYLSFLGFAASEGPRGNQAQQSGTSPTGEGGAGGALAICQRHGVARWETLLADFGVRSSAQVPAERRAEFDAACRAVLVEPSALPPLPATSPTGEGDAEAREALAFAVLDGAALAAELREERARTGLLGQVAVPASVELADGVTVGDLADRHTLAELQRMADALSVEIDALGVYDMEAHAAALAEPSPGDVRLPDMVECLRPTAAGPLAEEVEQGIAGEREITDAWIREQEERFLGLEAFKAALAAEEATERPFTDFERFLARVLADNNADRLPTDGTLRERLVEQAIAAVRAQEPAARFRVVSAAEFAATPSARWRVKGVLPESGLAMVYGAPGSGKSFFALDLCASIARGQAWRGRRTAQGRVAYVAAEGRAGFAVRLRAYLKANGLDRLDGLGVIGETPNFFTSSGDHHALAEAVQVWGGADVIVVDTLAASSSGADENTAKELGAVLGKLGKVQAATGGLVVLVHHSGKDESRGARGWSGLKAAVDAEIEVSRPDEEQPGRLARVTKQKDGESGQVFPFELAVVELGADEDGEPITSCVVRPTVEVPVKRQKVKTTEVQRPRGQYQQVAYDLIVARGTVPLDDVLDAMVERMREPAEGERDQRRSNARRDVDQMIAKDFIEVAPGGCLRPRGLGEFL